MKEIQLGKIIKRKRRENHITQDELAEYLNVSKAAISKWETEQSYPDISLLPLLASYFNISVDTLIGYQPQMRKEDIRKLYLRFCHDFQEKSFEEVIKEWQKVVKKYHSCFPLLLQMGLLLVNHINLASEQSQAEWTQEALRLFQYIEKESDDTYIKQETLGIQAYCFMLLNRPEEIIDLLDGSIKPRLSEEVFLSTAYQMKGNLEKAEEIIQITTYQNIMELLGRIPQLLYYATGHPDKRDYWIKGFQSMEELFTLREMHPTGMMPCYLAAAQNYAMTGDFAPALNMLQEYCKIATGDIYPLELRGNEYLDKIDNWLAELDLGKSAPRSDKLVKQSMAEALEAFAPFFTEEKEKKEYNSMLTRLKQSFEIEGES